MTRQPGRPNTANGATSEPDSMLPDFCDGQVLLLLMLIAEGLAIVLTLSQREQGSDLWVYLGNTSFFIQSIALTDAALLCSFKRRFRALSGPLMHVSLYGLLQLATILVTWLAHLITERIFDSTAEELALLLLRNLCVSAIITGAMLRYFYLRQQHRQQQRSEGEARIQALQARIRPHFLFNSLNTIANLIHRQPDTAEEALLDLAELFRSTLGKQARINLGDELEIVRRYLRIEQLRLGERLQVAWQVPTALESTEVPSLILQPLIENAVYHGIEPRADGGHVKISARAQNGAVIIEIDNPLPPPSTRPRVGGNQVAVENIRQRLRLAYGDAAGLTQTQNEGLYTVAVTIPVDGDGHANTDR